MGTFPTLPEPTDSPVKNVVAYKSYYETVLSGHRKALKRILEQVYANALMLKKSPAGWARFIIVQAAGNDQPLTEGDRLQAIKHVAHFVMGKVGKKVLSERVIAMNYLDEQGCKPTEFKERYRALGGLRAIAKLAAETHKAAKAEEFAKESQTSDASEVERSSADSNEALVAIESKTQRHIEVTVENSRLWKKADKLAMQKVKLVGYLIFDEDGYRFNIENIIKVRRPEHDLDYDPDLKKRQRKN